MPAIDATSAPTGTCIAVRIGDPEALFHPLDAGGGLGRTLADPIEAYIMRKAALLPEQGQIQIQFELHRLPANAPADGASASIAADIMAPDIIAPDIMTSDSFALRQIFHGHFSARSREIAHELSDTTRRGLRYLATGMSLLTVCMVLGYLGKTYVFREPYGTFIETGLSVFGWVANWRPVETLLYERRIVQRKLALCARLVRAEVECRVTDKGRPV